MEPNKAAFVGKKLSNFLRLAFFMLRKGLISKRKMVMDMNLMMKRGRLMGKSWVKNFAFNHQPRGMPPSIRSGFGSEGYEFSFGNSPNPIFSQATHNTRRRHHTYFPCMSTIVEDDASADADVPSALPSIEYSPRCFDDLVPGGKFTPQPSPFSVRVSNYSSDEENVEIDGNIDFKAEEFIQRFYEQLQIQNRMQLLEYQVGE